MSHLGRLLDTFLPLLASVVFVVLWLYVAIAILTDSPLPADTWAWLQGLDVVAAVAAWLALLPIGVFLWAWDSGLEPLFFGLVLVALGVWTALAWSSSVRALARRRRQA